jgi:hypothetical protein
VGNPVGWHLMKYHDPDDHASSTDDPDDHASFTDVRVQIAQNKELVNTYRTSSSLIKVCTNSLPSFSTDP